MEITISSLEDIDAAARLFVRAMGDNTVFAFYGSMGAGKTTFIKAICSAMGVRETVTSPTFAIVNEYGDADGCPVYHFDFYRIRKVSEAFDMGCEEYFNSGFPCFIEWPELIEDILPEDAVRIAMRVLPDGTRTVVF